MPAAPITLDTLRRYAVARTLFTPTTLPAAIKRLGFVQADPIRAPARAQDLTLRHRVKGYRAGDLERRYAALGIEEDFFVNYGFVPRATQALMHPRTPRTAWPPARVAQAQAVLAFVQERSHGASGVHPREVDAHFAHGRATNWFGGTSSASTQLLDAMHYRGMLRIAGRVSGVRTYAVPVVASDVVSGPESVPASDALTPTLSRPAGEGAGDGLPSLPLPRLESWAELAPSRSPDQALDALIDVIVHKYAPLPERSLAGLLSLLLRGGVPQWAALRPGALARAKQRLASAVVDGVAWYWPQAERPSAARYTAQDGVQGDGVQGDGVQGEGVQGEGVQGEGVQGEGVQGDGVGSVRLLAPFDPLVWDRRRFELLWGWAYRFEAYTPPAKRVRGYYALPLLWRDQVIGWGNLSVTDGALCAELGYAAGKAPREAAFKRALEQELAQMQNFLLPKT